MTPNLGRLIVVALVLAAIAVADVIWRANTSDVAAPVIRPGALSAERPMPRPQAQTGASSPAVAPAVTPVPTASNRAARSAWPAPAPLTNYKAVFAAPLFSPRRAVDAPPPAALASPVKPPDPLDGARLVGVARGQQGAIAIVESGGHIERIEPGDLVGDWVLSEVRPDAVVFSHNDETRELSIAH